MIHIAIFFSPPVDPKAAEAPWSLYQLMRASIQRVSPKARFHLLTLDDAPVPKGVPFDAIVRIPGSIQNRDRLMLDEVESWHNYICSDYFCNPTIFMDFDILAQKDVDKIFEHPYDIGLTWDTDLDQQPINAGVIPVRPDNREAVKAFFSQALDCIRNLPPKYHDWYGDQEALAKVVDWDGFDGVTPEETTVQGATVRLFSCAEWNYSEPYEGPDNKPVLKNTPEPVFVHFKGKRKYVMMDYASRFLNIRIKPDSKKVGGYSFFPNR